MPLLPGRLIRRYKRFLADVILETGEEVTAHCPNPGAMLGLDAPGQRIWLEPNDDPRKKLKYGWRLTEMDGGAWVGIDTGIPNRVVKEALTSGAVQELAGYQTIRPEVPYGDKSRIDFLATEDGLPDAYIEVKNAHLMREAGLAEFPDCRTDRGAKHLRELSKMAQNGHRAVMLYLVQRTDCSEFQIACDLDRAYAAAYAEAKKAGVEMLCYGTAISVEEVVLDKPIAIKDE
jgi:sugar fermentation stimulation protein A